MKAVITIAGFGTRFLPFTEFTVTSRGSVLKFTTIFVSVQETTLPCTCLVVVRLPLPEVIVIALTPV